MTLKWFKMRTMTTNWDFIFKIFISRAVFVL